MSASNKKKLRKEQEAALLTEKQLAEKKEAKKLKIHTITFAVIMLLVVCIAVGTIAYTAIYKTGVFQKNTVAATIDEHKLSSVDLGYYYVDAISKQYSDWHSSYGDYTVTMLQYMGLDLTYPLGSQYIDESTTWSDYFISLALENARGVYALYDAAVAEGFEMPEEDKSAMEENLQLMQDYADLFNAGDIDSYIEQIYGTGADMESYTEYVNVISTANSYQSAYYDTLSYDDADIRAHEAEHYNDYTSYSFAYKFIDYNSFLGDGTTDEEGNVTHTDEEIATAQEAARTTAESLTTAQTVDEFDKMISALPIYAPTEGETTTETVSTKAVDELLTDVLSALREWLSADERKEGDMTVLPYTTDTTNEDGTVTSTLMGYFAVFYQSKDENLEPLANVRHLLVAFEGGTTDSTTGTTTYSDDEKAAAKAEAEELLETWKKGAATEESFIELVKEHSDDGSAEEGGLFEDIAPDSNYVESFLNWSIDPDREAGDTEVIESEFGYHVMYYVGDSDITFRDRMIRDDLIANAYDAWIAEKEEGVTAELGNTKFMYHDYIVYSSAY